MPEQYDIPPELSGMRLDAALARLVPDCSRTVLQRWLAQDRVRVDGRTVTASQRVESGQSVHLERPAPAAHGPDRPEPIELVVRHADADLLVVDKPAGLVVHPGAGNAAGTLVNALLHHDPALALLPRAGIVHRLDKDTSGALLVARHAGAHMRLVAAMAARAIRREYRALVHGELVAGGTVDAPIGRHSRERTRMAVGHGGRPAVTHYRVRRRLRRHTLVDVEIETGRTHQIRVHLAHVGHPVIGDRTYGRAPTPPPRCDEALRLALQGLQRQALHACALTLPHPADDRLLRVESPWPDDLAALLALLERDADAHRA